ncbi:unnamed protein product [Cochlearia groenlandica]
MATSPPNPPANPTIQTRRIQTQAHSSIVSKLQRKPLGDCTNTVSRTSQHSSSSSAAKFANPSLSSSLKRLVNQTSLKEKTQYVANSKTVAGSSSPKPLRPVTRRKFADPDSLAPTPQKPEDDNNSKADSKSASRVVATSVRPVTRRMTADLDFPASAPSRTQKSRLELVVSDKEVAEPYTVYTVRRKASGIKRNIEAPSSGGASRLRLDLMPSSRKRTYQENDNKSKPLKRAPKKRQRTVKDKEVANGILQDYIEQQRAYFAEVDAFELSEEEVSSSDID